MEKGNKKLLLGIIIGVVIAVAFFFSFYDLPQPTTNPIENISIDKKPGPIVRLTDEDFKIVSVVWNDYKTNFSEDGNWKLLSEPIPWYDDCYGRNIGDNYSELDLMYSYTIIKQQSEDLNCNFILNGVSMAGEDNKTEYVLLEKEENVLMGLYPLSFWVNNNIVMCCSTDVEERGEVCKSITLPAKCSNGKVNH
jgi:hypothetical protein